MERISNIGAPRVPTVKRAWPPLLTVLVVKILLKIISCCFFFMLLCLTILFLTSTFHSLSFVIRSR